MEKLILKVQTKTNHGDFDEFVVFESNKPEWWWNQYISDYPTDKLDLGVNSKNEQQWFDPQWDCEDVNDIVFSVMSVETFLYNNDISHHMNLH